MDNGNDSGQLQHPIHTCESPSDMSSTPTGAPAPRFLLDVAGVPAKPAAAPDDSAAASSTSGPVNDKSATEGARPKHIDHHRPPLQLQGSAPRLCIDMWAVQGSSTTQKYSQFGGVYLALGWTSTQGLGAEVGREYSKSRSQVHRLHLKRNRSYQQLARLLWWLPAMAVILLKRFV